MYTPLNIGDFRTIAKAVAPSTVYSSMLGWKLEHINNVDRWIAGNEAVLETATVEQMLSVFLREDHEDRYPKCVTAGVEEDVLFHRLKDCRGSSMLCARVGRFCSLGLKSNLGYRLLCAEALPRTWPGTICNAIQRWGGVGS